MPFSGPSHVITMNFSAQLSPYVEVNIIKFLTGKIIRILVQVVKYYACPFCGLNRWPFLSHQDHVHVKEKKPNKL